MKSSTRDRVEGNVRQATGKMKEVAGKIVKDRSLEAEGRGEKLDGKIQEKIGQIKNVAGK